jgi:hypothetical protein
MGNDEVISHVFSLPRSHTRTNCSSSVQSELGLEKLTHVKWAALYFLSGVLKRLLPGLSGLFLMSMASFAYGEALQFVYIHGTNENSSVSQKLYNERVAKLHPEMKAALEKEPLIKAHLLENGQLPISPKTLNFFWGDKSHLSITAVRRNVLNIQLNKGFFKLAERGREKLAYTLHDAVWVEQQSNKKIIVNGLYDAVTQAGPQPIMLMGHSAGSLVAYDFLMYRLPYLDIQDFGKDLHVDPAVLAKFKASGTQNTCLEALLSSSAIRYDAQGKLVAFFSGLESQIPSDFLAKYRAQWLQNLPGFTQQYCLPENKVRGLVTFGSPLALFYSLAVNPERDESYLTASMVRYMLAHQMVWLHVNHSDDIIALPLPDKPRILEVITNRLGTPPVLQGGFVKNYVYINRGANFINAHGWYWRKPKNFSQAVAKAYHQGYLQWYPQ